MKNMRKLVPAFAMLMVAAIMMSTASFAWFSSNKQATASGMNVQAKSSGGLAIASWTGTVGGTPVVPDGNAFSSSDSAKWKNGAGVLNPVSFGGTKWYEGQSDSIDSATVNTSGYAEIDADEHASYYLATKWDIKTLDAAQALDIVVTNIAVENIGSDAGNAELAKALRVAIKTDSGCYYFAPQYDDGTFTYVSDAGTKATYNASGSNTLNFSDDDVTILTGVSVAPETIEIYVYFEGEDGNCKSANAINLKTLAVTIDFEAQ